MSHGAVTLPEPGAAVFESFVRVRFHEVDSLGHVNNASYLNYLEQAAIDHATLLGLGMDRMRELGGVFVAHRHEVEFVRPAFMGDVLRVVTWLGETRGARVDRHYLVQRADASMAHGRLEGAIVAFDETLHWEGLIVRATTGWVFVSESGRPRRIPSDVTARFREATPQPLM